MLKRTIEISREPAHLTVRDRQLLILRKTEPPKHRPANPPNLAASIPIEDVGLIMVDEGATTYSHALLAEISAAGAAVCICGRDHQPAGLLLPLGEHSQVVWRLRDQIRISRPVRKQLWRRIVQAKLRAQAAVLDRVPHAVTPGGAAALRRMARDVRSGDPDNCEAQGARVYWACWMADHFDGDPDAFRRVAKPPASGRADPAPNAMLNYGYAVLRAAMARALVAAGLLPALGIHHHHRANAFCLADDLIEPLRTFVDLRVRSLWSRGWTRDELPQTVKAELLSVLTDTAEIDSMSPVDGRNAAGPLMVVMHRYAASLAVCYAGVGGAQGVEGVLIPRRWEPGLERRMGRRDGDVQGGG